MGALRRVALLMLALVSVVVMASSPAFATPRLTTSTGTRPDNGAVSPFISPIGNTLDRSITITFRTAVGARLGSSFSYTSFLGTRIAFTCLRVTASGEISPTHTRIALYSFDILGCRDDAGGSVITFATNHISSSNPWYIHLTRSLGGNSADAVLEIPAGSSLSFVFLIDGADHCESIVQPQSIRGITLTERARTIALNTTTTIDFSLPSFGRVCPDPRGRLAMAAVTSLPYTADDGTSYTIQDTSRLP